MKAFSLLLFLLGLVSTEIQAQELFIQEEPASTLPKGVVGIRIFAEGYEEPGNQTRGLFALRTMYGLSRKLTLMATASMSNHHSKELPPDFPNHNTPQIGVPLPWRFNGVNVYAKYRILSLDGEKTHFRVAAYGSASWLDVAHDEAEPNLLDDTKGLGLGIISTWLRKHFAASFTGGYILPADYRGDVPDPIPGLPGVPARVRYGRAWNYSLSFGYLLFPFSYKDYRQTNINLYAELIGRSYTAGKVYFENIGSGSSYEMTGTAAAVFMPNVYLEFHPGIQAIISSNLRVDFSTGFPIFNKSYAHYYPIFKFGIQRYFYR